MHWVYLSIAIIAEVVATSALKQSEGFTHLWPSVLVVIGYAVAFYCLSLTLKSIPVGVAYAVWSGLGVVFVSLVGLVYFGQEISRPGIIGISLIVTGVAVLNLFSSTSPH